jgi:hypothetical protein
MLKYQKGRYPECDNTNSFDLKKCNASLYNKISYNTDFLYRKRCLFMTFKEYKEQKVHINNNMFCYVFNSINEEKIKDSIKAKLEEIKNTMLRPTTLKIPLPIYVMMAKRLENVNNENIFTGNYEVVLYIPNLYNYKNNNAEYTFFPSLDAFSKQNRWIELMTSEHSKYLDIIKRRTLKDNQDKIKKKNFFMNDMTFSCLNMGCVSNEKEPVLIPEFSLSDDALSGAVKSLSPYYPKSCLQTPYYNKQMINLDSKENIRYYGSTNVLSDTFDVDNHCIKEYDKDTFDKFLCDGIKICKKYEGQTDPKYDNEEHERLCYNTTTKKKIEGLMTEYSKRNFNAGYKGNEYSEEYNNNILKELAFRKIRYPGPGDIQEIVFSMFVINENLFDENLFCYMPWGNKLLKQDYVINEYDNLEIDRVSFKSFNNVFEMKFNSDGYLYIYENNKIKSQVPKQSKSCNSFTKKVLRFENMVLNIYGNDIHGNYDLRAFVSLNNTSMYKSPASLILSDNNGDLILYDLGINNKSG